MDLFKYFPEKGPGCYERFKMADTNPLISIKKVFDKEDPAFAEIVGGTFLSIFQLVPDVQKCFESG